LGFVGKAFATGEGFQSTFQIGGPSCEICQNSNLPATGFKLEMPKSLENLIKK
jgi:hypothetical protein